MRGWVLVPKYGNGMWALIVINLSWFASVGELTSPQSVQCDIHQQSQQCNTLANFDQCRFLQCKVINFQPLVPKTANFGFKQNKLQKKVARSNEKRYRECEINISSQTKKLLKYISWKNKKENVKRSERKSSLEL